MPILRCRHCSVPLTEDELRSGTCPDCNGILAEDTPSELAPRPQESPPAGSSRGRYLIGALVLCVGGWFLWFRPGSPVPPTPEPLLSQARPQKPERIRERPLLVVPAEIGAEPPAPEPVPPEPLKPEPLTVAPLLREEQPQVAVRPVAPVGTLRVQYKCLDASAKPNQLRFHLRIVNDGNEAVPLSDLSVRYWYTRDANEGQNCVCDWATLGKANVLRTVQEVRAVPGADTCLLVAFARRAADLPAGKDSGEIQLRIHRTNWSRFAQPDDYSLNPTANEWTDAPKITLYLKGNLVWGIEPVARLADDNSQP